jgi:hypothetical protein
MIPLFEFNLGNVFFVWPIIGFFLICLVGGVLNLIYTIVTGIIEYIIKYNEKQILTNPFK